MKETRREDGRRTDIGVDETRGEDKMWMNRVLKKTISEGGRNTW